MEGHKGHSFGRESLGRILEWCFHLGIKEVSLYTLSVDNLKRPQQELDTLYALFKETFEKACEHESFFMQNKIKVRFLGKKELLPKEVQDSMAILESKTKDFTNLRVNFCIAYSSTQEFKDCIDQLKDKQITEITKSILEENLYGGETVKPDIIVRTSGEIRLSNFFLYQGQESVLLFLKCLWPEFSMWDMYRIISTYTKYCKR